MSQCETEEPPSKGLGVYMVGAGVSSIKDAFTPEPNCALIVFPSAIVIETTGIVKTTTPYFQPIAAATGSYHSLQDRQVRTDVLGAGGFQFLISAADK